MHDISAIIRAFGLDPNSHSYQPFGSGHINDTYLLKSDQQPSYLLQRINHEVFKDVDGLMRNMQLVTAHLRRALDEEQNPQFTTVQLISTQSGKLYHQDEAGNYWRIQTFIPDSISYDLVTSEEQAFQAGFAFGYFQKLLRDLPSKKLAVTIPDFHNMEYRFDNFERARDNDIRKRKAEVQPEIDYANNHKQPMLDWYDRYVRKGVLGVTHNDTKFNNVLLNKSTQRAYCIIDLDTVMPGVVGYDFGDAIRTTVNTSTEDETDREKIDVNLDYYRAFTCGFMQQLGPFLSKNQISSLAFSAHYMTFIMGLRFLTDYLAGDTYYKIYHPKHNLDRARAQFALVTQLEKYEAEAQAIIRKWEMY